MTGVTPSEDTPSDNGISLAAFRIEYAKADKFCQQVQDYISQAGIPALNELRNAGHHLLKSLDDKGIVVRPGELTRAHNHAKRACYEAGEAGVLMALDNIRAFREEFRTVLVTTILPDYVNMMAETEQAREAVLAVRTDDEDRSNDYQLRIDAFETLRKIDRKLDAARPECVTLLDGATTDSRRFLLNIGLVTIIGWRYGDLLKVSPSQQQAVTAPASPPAH
jgi:uncharacterized protein YeeX (DUF496 family)